MLSSSLSRALYVCQAAVCAGAARWRSEKPNVVEEYKSRAEEEKRQHAIAHPGYRYQSRKPFEKKRMTKSKLAKLVANPGSINATMDARRILAATIRILHKLKCAHRTILHSNSLL